MKLNNIAKFIIAFGVTFAAAAAGSLATFSQIPTWYVNLNKTSLTPPNWVFGPVWTTLYILMAIAMYLVWTAKTKKPEAKQGSILFVEQLFFNAAWSIVFFGFHQILFAFVIIIVLWLTILANIIWFFKVSKSAGYLMLPYIAWVSFASILNFAVYLANR